MSSVSPVREPEAVGAAFVDERGFVDAASWDQLAAADADQFASAWLDLQCRLIGQVQVAVLVLRDPAGDQLIPRCWWTPATGSSMQQPSDSGASAALSAVAELAVERKRGALRRLGGDGKIPAVVQSLPAAGKTAGLRGVFAWPLLSDEPTGAVAHGVVAVEIAPLDDQRMHLVMRLLQWGAAWWQPQRLQTHQAGAAEPADLQAVLRLLVSAMEEPRLEAAATAAVTELAVALGCDRVAYGANRGQRGARVLALSHSAEFNKKTSLVRDIAAAMDEAIDQQALLALPEPEPEPEPELGPQREPRPDTADDARGLAGHALRQLAEKHGAAALCVVPLSDAQRVTGALCLERGEDRPFDEAERALCRHAAVLLGPVLEAKRVEERWIGAKNWDAFTALLGRLLGQGNLALKTGAISALSAGLFLAFADGQYRLNGPAVLEGQVQRALTAPLDGFIAEAAVRPGDLVSAGDTLAALEDKDLKLEQAKWSAELAKLAREYSQAIAERNRAEMRILGARIDQAEARSALVAEQLARTTLTAPFEGVIVAGDLSQSIGAPVSRGDVLFELAPLRDYRVVLKIDERDVNDVYDGQQGRVALAGLPARPLPIEVVKLTPVAEAEEGANRFRVEARLLEPSELDTVTDSQPAELAAPPPGANTLALLRPGMRGIGKLDVGERNLFWIWTHRLQHWLRTQWWAWNG